MNRIDVSYVVGDARELVACRAFNELGLSGKVTGVEVVDTYTVDAKLTAAQLRKSAAYLTNKLTQKSLVNKEIAPGVFSFTVEVGYLPGVTDNVATTVKETIEDGIGRKFKKGEGAYTSQTFYITGKITEGDAKKIALSLHNPLIQRASVKSAKQFKRKGGFGITVPKVMLTTKPRVLEVDLDVSDEELSKIGKTGVCDTDGTRRGPLALSLPYMQAIQKHFKKLGRKATDVEIEALGQTWSEHCKHTIFADPLDDIKEGLYKTYIKGATNKIRKQKGKKDFCVSVFSDNSGIIEFDKDYHISHKVETHNTPSLLDPFGGAITGIVGVNRDAIGTGLGAKPIVNTYAYCFADPKDKSKLYKGKGKTQEILSARRIMEGVIAGVNAGGNQSGIPTPQGLVYFDERYRGKPLVYCGSVGLLPKKTAGRPSHKKAAKPGDYIVMVGGRVGLDGIHGATFSSEGMDEGSPATAVQIGDPITQKKFSDAIVKEARDMGLYNSITDNGAGGLSSSIAEMAKESGGCDVQLADVPLKYPGLDPWQIWISESQERMTLSVSKSKWKKFNDLMKRRGVEATVIGTFTKSGKCVVRFGRKKAIDLSMKFLHDGLPTTALASQKVGRVVPEGVFPKPKDLGKTLLDMLGRPSIASYEFISKQYDHEVQSSSVTKPLAGSGRVNAGAFVVRPVLESPKAVVLSHGINPSYSDVDTYDMAAAAIDTAVRANIVAGGSLSHLALLDNFCWSSSDDPKRLYELKRACKAAYDTAVAYGTPFISGKDSMYNDFKGFDDKGKPTKISVPPTLLVSSIGVIDDATRVVTEDLKASGDIIFLIGETKDELGGSEYGRMVSDALGKKITGKRAPGVDTKKNKAGYQSLERAISKGLVVSSISVALGGLGIALAKTAMAGGLGVDISCSGVRPLNMRDDHFLFSESQGRVLVSVRPEDAEKFEKVFNGKKCKQIGEVTSKKQVKISNEKGKELLCISLDRILNSYRKTLSNY